MTTEADDATLARAVLDAVCAVPGVAGISRGRFAVARTYGLGGTVVEGIQLAHTPEGLHVEVHVVVELVPIPALADAVRVAVAAALRRLGASATTVDVWVDDLRGPAREEESA